MDAARLERERQSLGVRQPAADAEAGEDGRQFTAAESDGQLRVNRRRTAGAQARAPHVPLPGVGEKFQEVVDRVNAEPKNRGGRAALRVIVPTAVGRLVIRTPGLELRRHGPTEAMLQLPVAN